MTTADTTFAPSGAPGILDKERTIATAGFNRWLVPPAALCIHLCIGMREDVVEKVFDPFFTTKRREGTGLGLSISQTLVKRQRGQITAESEPGNGSTFRVWLPEAD